MQTRPRSSLRSAEALRPAAALPAALVGRDPHGYYGLSAPVPTLVISRPTLWESVPVPALLVSQVLCGCRCPLAPFTWRTTLGTSQSGCKAFMAPALPHTSCGCGAESNAVPLPASFPHPLAIVMG